MTTETDMSKDLPDAAGDIAAQFPELWSAYAALGESAAKAGPLTGRERRLVKLALAIGAGSEGAVHSHTRRAEADGVDRAAAVHVALLAIGTLGFSRAVAAKTWIEDILGDRA